MINVDQRRTAWVLSNGMIGMDNQSVGLAEALNLNYQIKSIVPLAPWKYLPPSLWCAPLSQLGEGSDSLQAPWPDVVIGTGRLNVAASIAIKRASGGHTYNIRIQHPRTNQQHFDLIVAPQHDHCRGPKVFETLGAVNCMSHSRLDQAASRFAARYAALPRPYVAVLLGGSNSKYTLDRVFAEQLTHKLTRLAEAHHASFLITPSRRTDPIVTQVLSDGLQGYHFEIWDGEGENPYFAYLGLADAVVVTADSVNMVSEACYTGKPVFVAGLSGGMNKFEQFHHSLQQHGCTRPFTGEWSTWQYEALDETRKAAHFIQHTLGWA